MILLALIIEEYRRWRSRRHFAKHPQTIADIERLNSEKETTTMIRLQLTAEFDTDNLAGARRALDYFREAVQPSAEYGITLFETDPSLAEAENEPSVVRQTACRHCGLDIEGFAPFPADEWRDRGNNSVCPAPYENRTHEPVEGAL